MKISIVRIKVNLPIPHKKPPHKSNHNSSGALRKSLKPPQLKMSSTMPSVVKFQDAVLGDLVKFKPVSLNDYKTMTSYANRPDDQAILVVVGDISDPSSCMRISPPHLRVQTQERDQEKHQQQKEEEKHQVRRQLRVKAERAPGFLHRVGHLLLGDRGY